MTRAARLIWASAAHDLAWQAKARPVAPAAIARVFEEALALLPDARAVAAISRFAINHQVDPVAAGVDLIDFLLGQFLDRAPPARFAWQDRVDLDG